jgi:co-chaperonin GroES (HSP10)
MKVLKDRILVSVQETGGMKTTKSGLQIPSDYLDNGDLEKATVIHVGKGVEDLEEGDEVFLYKGAGKEFKIDGEKFRTVTIADIIVVL